MWIASLLATAAPLAQTERWQQLSLNRATRVLDRQRVLMAEMYSTENQFEESLHKRKLSLARELHLNEMSHDLGIAQREAVRDDWAQHSLYLQSLMMMASLMFSCVCAIFCEASISLGSSLDVVAVVVGVAATVGSNGSSTSVLPSSSPSSSSRWDSGASAVLFSFLCAVGISSSLLSLWLGLKIQSRMAEFDFHSPTAVYTPCNATHFEFSEYHGCHLREIEKASFIFFLISVVCTVLSGCLTYCASLAVTWESSDGNNSATEDYTIPYWAPIIISCVAVIVIVFGSFFGFSKMRGLE